MDISLITLVGSCIVAFITAVFGPVAAEWAKKRFSSHKIKSRHKHRVFRAKVKNSRRKSKKNKN